VHVTRLGSFRSIKVELMMIEIIYIIFVLFSILLFIYYLCLFIFFIIAFYCLLWSTISLFYWLYSQLLWWIFVCRRGTWKYIVLTTGMKYRHLWSRPVSSLNFKDFIIKLYPVNEVQPLPRPAADTPLRRVTLGPAELLHTMPPAPPIGIGDPPTTSSQLNSRCFNFNQHNQ
jgi:hypothetical protein